MLTSTIRISLVAFTGCLSYSQTFDAASVKPATPPVPDGRGRIMMMGPSGGPGTKDPGRIRYPNMSLKNVLMTAYDVKNFQIAGPGWLDTERFDITAVMPPETTKEQFRVMLQNLLSERFKLTVHRETKELPMYSLVVARNGPKMKESAEVPAPKDDGDPANLPPPPPLPSQPKIGPDGFPILPLPGRGGIFFIMMPGRTRLIGQQQTMQDLAERLTSQLNRPVTDATALKAKYDFTLTFAVEGVNMILPIGMMPAPPPPPPPPGGGGAPAANLPEGETPPDIFAAVQAQLGLKLESKKGPVEQIVIDHVEKTPTEN
jgi:uncharacterized protein (TIGR03435 family)